MGFDARVLLHVAGILLTVVLLGWCLLQTQFYATMLVLALILLAQLWGLLRLVHTTNRELARFLEALKYLDFSQRFSTSGRSGSFRELSAACNALAERLRTARSEREQEAAWLQAVIQHLPVAVLVCAEAERILASNTALQRLLGRVTAPDSLAAIALLDPALATAIRELQPGREQVLRSQRQGETLQLKLSCTLLRSGGTVQKLVCIQNIEGELEGRELEAWQNLIRVMTHEIMNSVTPLTSLADTAGHYVDEARTTLGQSRDAETRETLAPLLDDAGSAVHTIGRRGQALLRFVTSYRSLSRLPAPVPRSVQLQDALRSSASLLAAQARQAGVTLLTQCRPSNLELQVDPEQLEQALINLLRNAIEACAGVSDPRVELQATLEAGGLIALTVRDNGCGIAPDMLEQIFVPFFTTKRQGSGIGMSVVKQIVRANGGRIAVASEPDAGTTVRLLFRHY